MVGGLVDVTGVPSQRGRYQSATYGVNVERGAAREERRAAVARAARAVVPAVEMRPRSGPHPSANEPLPLPRVPSRIGPPTAGDLEAGRLATQLRELGVPVIDWFIDPAHVASYIDKAGYTTSYADYYQANRMEKTLEHYVAARLLSFGPGQRYLDVASGGSAASSIYEELFPVESCAESSRHQRADGLVPMLLRRDVVQVDGARRQGNPRPRTHRRRMDALSTVLRQSPLGTWTSRSRSASSFFSWLFPVSRLLQALRVVGAHRPEPPPPDVQRLLAQAVLLRSLGKPRSCPPPRRSAPSARR